MFGVRSTDKFTLPETRLIAIALYQCAGEDGKTVKSEKRKVKSEK